MYAKITDRTLDQLDIPSGRAQLAVWDVELRGFGVIIGRTSQSFVVNYRAGGPLRRQVIGRRGAIRDDGRVWNAALARQRALVLLGKVADGIDPSAEARALRSGPSLREALDFHVSKMERGENRRGKVCSPRSIATLRGGVELHLKVWLDRPLVDLTADVLDAVRAHIEREATRIQGSNERNPPGRAVANRLLANVSAIWRSYHKRYGLPVANPTERLIPGALEARENRIDNHELKSWHELVMKMKNGVRRDLQRVALFTGVRTDGIRRLRWEDVDFDEELIQIRNAKGDRPYTIPMVGTVRDILKARQPDNERLFAAHGGDDGWCFPSLARDLKRVQHVAEPKERAYVRDKNGDIQRDDDDKPLRETY
ncbi:MAG TPA: tyrosine-type recombinase/integrase, partial [Kofleriaceae bacterium]|nr:tyrosine-type recombinase/integrase [Kofleriaceae bacterium]